jgi:hypothetical protein
MDFLVKKMQKKDILFHIMVFLKKNQMKIQKKYTWSLEKIY